MQTPHKLVMQKQVALNGVVRQLTMDFDSRTALTTALQQTLRPHERTVILGGHYTLVFDSKRARFRPLVISEYESWSHDTALRDRLYRCVGDFPEATFQMAADLTLNHPTSDSKIMLLVNDVHFRLFQRNAPTGKCLAELRHAYYRGDDLLPGAMIEMLREKGRSTDIFERNDAVRHESHTLPSQTFMFSELILQKDFIQSRRRALAAWPEFQEVTSLFSGTSFVYKPLATSETCLVGPDGECRCSGATMELLLKMASRDVRNLILFIPEECRPQVSSAANIAFSLLSQFSRITLVWGGLVMEDHKAELRTATFLERGE